MEKKAIEIKNLNFIYPDGRCALKGISLDIYEHDSVAIIGPNGAGKSTLLLHMNGLLEGKGVVRVFEQLITRQNLASIRQKVGLVFQDPQDQLFMPTVYEDVAFGPENLGLGKDKIKEAAEYALAAVGMSEKGGYLSHHLSLGEQKRASIATVLSMFPRILVLDEPNSNLDPASRRQLINILKPLEVTKIIATHDLEMVLDLCTSVVILDKAEVVARGKTIDMLSDKALLERHGLEVPVSLSFR